MAAIDIRNSTGAVDKIRFADVGDRTAERDDIGDFLCADNLHHPKYIFVESTTSGTYQAIRKGDVENLIKALQKAVELGWTK